MLLILLSEVSFNDTIVLFTSGEIFRTERMFLENSERAPLTPGGIQEHIEFIPFSRLPEEEARLQCSIVDDETLKGEKTKSEHFGETTTAIQTSRRATRCA